MASASMRPVASVRCPPGCPALGTLGSGVALFCGRARMVPGLALSFITFLGSLPPAVAAGMLLSGLCSPVSCAADWGRRRPLVVVCLLRLLGPPARRFLVALAVGPGSPRAAAFLFLFGNYAFWILVVGQPRIGMASFFCICCLTVSFYI